MKKENENENKKLSAPAKCYKVEETDKEYIYLKVSEAVSYISDSDKWKAPQVSIQRRYRKNGMFGEFYAWPPSSYDSYDSYDIYACKVSGKRTHSKTVLLRIQDRTGREVEQLDNNAEEWPTHCDCGFEFNEDTCKKETISIVQYKRVDTGEVAPLTMLPPGAAYYADWIPQKGQDGHCLVVKLPDGVFWCVDGQAANCTRPEDGSHKCWCRHGSIENPETLNVDKNGNTCGAGAGSILTSTWHGWLRNGVLTGEYLEKDWHSLFNPHDKVFGE